jgi:hypothetical protein
LTRASTIPCGSPLAAACGLSNVRNDPDQITPKLGPLHFYQLAIRAPRPPKGSFDEEAGERGRAVFNGTSRCTSCHIPPLFTEPGRNMHTPQEIGTDDFQANRAPDQRYRTSCLPGECDVS